MAKRKASEAGTNAAAADAMPDIDSFLPPEDAAAATLSVAETTAVAVKSSGDEEDDGLPQTEIGRMAAGMDTACIMDPLTGELIDRENVDGLIGMYESLDKANKIIYATCCRIRETLAEKTEGDAKTRRVRGHRRVCVLEFPSESFEQRLLKEAWADFPDLRDEALKIDSIGVKLREFRKIKATSGGERFNEFRDRISMASRGCVGLPTLKVEK